MYYKLVLARYIVQCHQRTILTIFFSNFKGLPTPLVAITDLESISPKKRNEHKQDIQKLINKYLPNEKLIPLDKDADGINILRRIGGQKRKAVLYRDRRPHLYAENVEFVADDGIFF